MGALPFSPVGVHAASPLSSIPGLPDGIPGLPDDFPDIPGEIPPFLLSSNPQNGATQVPVNSPVSFTFFTEMAPTHAVTWSANVAPANFTYSWSGDGKTLTATYAGSFPAASVITWTLEPSGFKSVGGTELLPANNSGTFTTASGSGDPNDPCDPGSTNATSGGINLFKSISYLQTNASPPSINPEIGASFLALVSSPPGHPISAASVRLPNGTTKSIENLFGTFMLNEQFETQEALDAAYPAGAYTVTITQASGTSTATLTLGNAAPPTPQVSNYPATQTYNAAADFTLQWLPFTGVTADDTLYLSVFAGGVSFNAPDLCVPRPLANTATSIVIPGNTFSAGGEKDGSISFSKVSFLNTNALPNISAYAAYSKTTEFVMRSGGEDPSDPPQLLNLVRRPDGSVQFDVRAKANAQLTVEGSTDLELWIPFTVVPATGGLISVTDTEAALLPYRFYRVSTP